MGTVPVTKLKYSENDIFYHTSHGHFGEVNEGFKQLICSLAKVAADSQEAYLALFTLIGAHSVVRFDGNELKNERKCTPRNEKMTYYAIH